MKKTMKRNVVLSAVMAIVLCVSLISGATFALFTSESNVNIAVTSGKVNVTANLKDLELYSPTLIGTSGAVVDETNAARDGAFANGGTAVIEGNTLTLENIVPGDRVNFMIEIVNNSNVTVKYRTILACTEDTGLFAGLKFDVGGATVVNKTEWTTLPAGEDIEDLACSVELPATAGNVYQEKTCTIGFTVEAVQGNAEMPDEWDGTSSDAPAEPSAWEDNEYRVSTAAQLVGVMQRTSAGQTNSWGYGKTVILDKDIDLNGQTIAGFGSPSDNICFTFDGNGHTISNFRIETDSIYAGLFNQFGGSGAVIKNLTVKDAVIKGKNMVGAISSNVEGNSSIENCKAINCILSGKQQVGAVVGYAARGTVKDCYAEGCTVIYSADAEYQDADCRILGYNNVDTVNTVENNTYKDVEIYAGVTPVFVSTAEEFVDLQNKSGMKLIVITDDIDMSAYPSRVGLHTSCFSSNGVTILGNGHTISGLTSALVNETTYAVTIKDLTVKNSDIKDFVSGDYSFAGAFVAYADFCDVALINCKLENTTVGAGNAEYVGGFVGYFTGLNLTISDCEVAADCTVKGNKNLAGIIGFCQTAVGCTQKIEACAMSATLTGGIYVGQVVGTANSTGLLQIVACTFTGAAYGRIVDASVKIDGDVFYA